jgi:hypothetical protein
MLHDKQISTGLKLPENKEEYNQREQNPDEFIICINCQGAADARVNKSEQAQHLTLPLCTLVPFATPTEFNPF